MRKIFLSFLFLLIITALNEATYAKINSKINVNSNKNDVTYCQDNCGSNPNNQTSGCIQLNGNTCGQNCDCELGNLCAASGYCLPADQVLCSSVNCPNGSNNQASPCQESYTNHSCTSNCDCSPGRQCTNGMCENS